MQALFFASALLFFEVCGLLIFALFVRGLVLDFNHTLLVRIGIFQRTRVK
jgi:hypothetical protein